MDWSSVFEDEGEGEGDWICENRIERLAMAFKRRRASTIDMTNLNTPQRKEKLASSNAYTPLICYAFTVNYILGVGSLGIPFAFQQSGLLLGACLILFVTWLSMVTVNFVVETGERARMISDDPALRRRMNGSTSADYPSSSSNSRGRSGSGSINLPEPTARTRLLQPLQPDDTSLQPRRMSSLQLRSLKFSPGAPIEVSELCSAFLGSRGQLAYTASLLGLMYVGLLAYAQVFTSSVFAEAEEWTGLRSTWYISVLFVCIVVPLSCMDLTEMIRLQMGLFCLNVLTLLLMSIVVASSFSTNLRDSGEYESLAHSAAGAAAAENVTTEMGLEMRSSTRMYAAHEGIGLDVGWLGSEDDNSHYRVGDSGSSGGSGSLWGTFLVAVAHSFGRSATAATTSTSNSNSSSSSSSNSSTSGSNSHRSASNGNSNSNSNSNSSSSGGASFTTTPLESRAPPIPQLRPRPITPPFHGQYRLVRFSGFGLMFSTAIFSQLFQHSVPGLIFPLDTAHKTSRWGVKRIFIGAVSTTAFFYLLLGVSCSVYFGARTERSINLNWSGFSWGLCDGPRLPPSLPLTLEPALAPASTRAQAQAACAVPAGLRIISYFVVLFPALNCISVYPLIAITLGNNLAVSLPIKLLGDKDSKRHVTFWRLAASVPPIVASVFVKDLALTLQVAGVFGLNVAFFTPALLQFRSLALVGEAHDRRNNVHRWVFSSKLAVCFVFLFAAVAGVIIVVQIFAPSEL